METPNPPALSEWFSTQLAVADDDLVRTWRTYCAYAEPFRKESESHEYAHN
jgi:hypothetical protein